VSNGQPQNHEYFANRTENKSEMKTVVLHIVNGLIKGKNGAIGAGAYGGWCLVKIYVLAEYI
jgi:hypothetical protein